MENWGDESVPVTRPRLDWLNLTGFVYLRLSQSSNVSKRLKLLIFSNLQVQFSLWQIVRRHGRGIVLCSRIASSTQGPR